MGGSLKVHLVDLRPVSILENFFFRQYFTMSKLHSIIEVKNPTGAYSIPF